MRKSPVATPKVALVYDWLTTPHGGAENVLLALHQIFPDAPLFTSISNSTQATWIDVFEVKTTWLQSVRIKNHRLLSVLMPVAFESLNFSEFDIVISVSSSEAKGVITSPHQLHVSYVLTPPRYLYSHQAEYLNSLPLVAFTRPIVQLVTRYLRWWDQVAAHRPDVMIPISQLVADRVVRYYQRQPAKTIYPPISTPPKVVSRADQLPSNFYLVVSRLISYKRIDLAIEACLKSGKNLVIIGDGPEKEKLSQLAAGAQSGQIQFLGHQPQSVVDEYRAGCIALLMPGIEDFGITALETVAMGKPVVLHHHSGAAELVKNGITGVFLKELSSHEIITAMEQLEGLTFDPVILRKSVAEYATDAFVATFKGEILSHWNDFRKGQNYE